MANNRMIPDVDRVIGKAIDELVYRRPKSLRHINYGEGRYSHIFVGWKAQANIVARRFASEAKATRLFDSGVALQQLCASEFDTVLASDATFAIGEVKFLRPSSPAPAGVVRKGHIFVKEAAPDAQPLAIQNARYECTRDILVNQGQEELIVPIKALNAGPAANTPSGKVIDFGPTINPAVTTTNLIAPATPIFDSTFVLTESRAAGGDSLPAEDKILRRAAAAAAQGRFGPNLGAIIAGALSYSGVSHLAVIENENIAKTAIFPVDETWSYSEELNNKVGQLVKDNWQGFGCLIQMGKVGNRYIHIACTVTLADNKYLLDTSPIANKISLALKNYFDERPDWWIWKTDALRSVIVSADRRVLTCSSVTMTDAEDSTVISEPGELSLTDIPAIQHWYLPDNAVNVTFLGPS